MDRSIEKVVVEDDYVIKNNTTSGSTGLEWVSEALSINHERELRVYRLYSVFSPKVLLIPKLHEVSPKHIKIERLLESDDALPKLIDIVPKLIEFSNMGSDERRRFFDLISSPTQSLVRGLLFNFRFLGLRIVWQALIHLSHLYIYSPPGLNCSLIHKDLKVDQNMIHTDNGLYFIDFGSSIITRHYFLTDIVELATDHQSGRFDFELVRRFISAKGFDGLNEKYVQAQIFILLLRRYLHLPLVDRKNEQIMQRSKVFIGSLNKLVNDFKICQEI